MSFDACTLESGVHHRVEDGRAFVVLDGTAIVEFDDRDSLIFVRQGAAYTLAPSARTRWTVPASITFLVPQTIPSEPDFSTAPRACGIGSHGREGSPEIRTAPLRSIGVRC